MFCIKKALYTTGIFLVFLIAAIKTHAAPPIANPDTRTVPPNSTITINVLGNDSDPDGDQLSVSAITQPNQGSASLNSDGSITFNTPANFTNGTIQFFYTLLDSGQEQSQGTVNIIVGNSALVTVPQNRGNDTEVAAILDSVCNSLRRQSDAELGGRQIQLLQRCNQLATLQANGDIETVARALNQIAPEETIAQMRSALDSNRALDRVVVQRIQQQKFAIQQGKNKYSPNNHIALNGRQWRADENHIRGAGASSDQNDFWSRLGVFGNIQFDESERDITTLENGYDADTTSVTIGADYFLTNHFLVGSSLSISDTGLDYKNDGGSLDTLVTKINFFGAYFYQDIGIYTQLGYGNIDFDSLRRIRYGTGTFAVDETVTGDTNGSQYSLNTRIEWSWEHNALSITPSFRADYLNSRIKAYDEIGGNGLASSLGEQRANQVTLSIGSQFTYTLTPSWGVLVPSLEISYQSETQSDRDSISGSFVADASDERFYSLNNNGGDTGFYRLALGSSAVFKHGLSGFFEYSRLLDYRAFSITQWQLGLRYEL